MEENVVSLSACIYEGRWVAGALIDKEPRGGATTCGPPSTDNLVSNFPSTIPP